MEKKKIIKLRSDIKIATLPAHPVSKKHKRMDVSERAAHFMPFSALKGYDSLLSDTKKSNDDMINNEIEHEEIDSI